MKFLVDAQLPRNLARWLAEAGHDALHTLDLPRKNRTTDAEVVERAVQDGRVVVSKDSDFVASYLFFVKKGLHEDRVPEVPLESILLHPRHLARLERFEPIKDWDYETPA
jgi:uncharacterized protein with PIN domain